MLYNLCSEEHPFALPLVYAAWAVSLRNLPHVKQLGVARVSQVLLQHTAHSVQAASTLSGRRMQAP